MKKKLTDRQASLLFSHIAIRDALTPKQEAEQVKQYADSMRARLAHIEPEQCDADVCHVTFNPRPR